MLSPFCYHTLAANGYEQQFAANHLGHFHLVNRLLSVMLASSSSTCARKCFFIWSRPPSPSAEKPNRWS
jgi:NAD(P)-dependent dehydrogenase (short-subunit alcohol dehydrogenase family)